MIGTRWFLVLFLLLISGCIESGNLNLPTEGVKINLSSFGSSQLKEASKATPSLAGMAVPLKSLPRSYLKSGEDGSYLEAFSLGGLPSTLVVWKVWLDPYGMEFERLKSEATTRANLTIASSGIDAMETEKENLYRLGAHLGIYTFAAETTTLVEIDRAGVYGTHKDVVRKVFEEGVKNALSYDLNSLED